MTLEYTKRQLQIIHAAVDLIAAGGMSALTMNHIAAEISVTEPALYRHFKSKKDILLGVINFMRKNRALPSETDKSGLDLIECILEGRIKKFTEFPALAAIIFSEEIFSGDSDLSQQIIKMMQETQQRFIRVIQAAQEAGSIRLDMEAEQIALHVIGSFRFLVTQWHVFNNEFDLDHRAATLFADFRKLFLI